MSNGGGSCIDDSNEYSYDWANRFPAIVDAARRLKATSFLIDGRDRPRRQDAGLPCVAEPTPGREVVLYASDLIGHGGDDLCSRQVARQGQAQVIRFTEHLTEDGPTVFKHV